MTLTGHSGTVRSLGVGVVSAAGSLTAAAVLVAAAARAPAWTPPGGVPQVMLAA